MRDTPAGFVRAAIVGGGVALAGLAIGIGASRIREADRYVTVKGVSEREVQADLAIWPLQVIGADNDLGTANAMLERAAAEVRRFMLRNGLDTSQVVVTGYSVSDASSNQYAPGGPVTRYVIRQTMLIRSSHAARVLAASQRVGELAEQGVAVTSVNPEGGPTFIFSGLNALKPAMIAEATARAREGAEQFAKDAGTPLAGIRRANQGVFEILPRDQAPGISEGSQVAKTVRVVSTLEYLLAR